MLWLFFFYGASFSLGPVTFTWFVQYIKVRDWTAILPSGITLKNAYRQRAAASDSAPLPQTFTFMRRGFMPRRAQGLQVSDRLPRSMRTDDMETQDNDVFAMMKESMSDSGLCQDPLLVMPGGLLGESSSCLLTANSSDCPLVTGVIDADRLTELRAIQRALQKDFPHMRRAVTFYDTLLAGGGENLQSVPKLTFLEHAHRQILQPHAPQFGAQPKGPKPHELQVVFHRSRWNQHLFNHGTLLVVGCPLAWEHSQPWKKLACII